MIIIVAAVAVAAAALLRRGCRHKNLWMHACPDAISRVVIAVSSSPTAAVVITSVPFGVVPDLRPRPGVNWRATTHARVLLYLGTWLRATDRSCNETGQSAALEPGSGA